MLHLRGRVLSQLRINMNLSDLRKIVREELAKVVKERTVPRDHYTDKEDRAGRRRMTKSQVADRDKIGKAMKAKPSVVANLKKKHGADWESFLWATAGNKTLGGPRGLEASHVTPKDGPILQEFVRLRDIANVVTLPKVNNLKEALPSSFPAGQQSIDMGGHDEEEGEEEHAKAKLMRLHKQSAAIYNMLGDMDDEVEEWVIQKIKDAAECINSAYNHIEYEKTKPSALGNGEGTPADSSGS